MKVIGIIPARYESSRFLGKPLADICGKPMIWWVYQRIKKAKGLSGIYIATDDNRIAQVCENLKINFMMTETNHSSSTERLNEVAHKIPADFIIIGNTTDFRIRLYKQNRILSPKEY